MSDGGKRREVKWEVILSVIAILIAIVTLVFGDNIYERITGRSIGDDWRKVFAQSSPSATPFATLSATTPILSSVTPNRDFSFSENFDNGLANGFRNKLGLWLVLSEPSGNKVLDINSMDSSSEYPNIEFGESSWKDFIFKSRINIVDYGSSNDAPLATIRFRGNYKVAFTPYWKGFDLVFDPPWTILAGRTTEIQKNTWYSVRIEASGNQINVFLDDKLTISETISRKSSGPFGFGTWFNAHVQFDDISIEPINK